MTDTVTIRNGARVILILRTTVNGETRSVVQGYRRFRTVAAATAYAQDVRSR